jgi:hypothetical protein
MTSGLLTVDPRDNIYGILGVADDDLRRHIHVDYYSPISVLYLEVAKYLLKIKQPNLNVFHLGNCFEEIETSYLNFNLPS